MRSERTSATAISGSVTTPAYSSSWAAPLSASAGDGAQVADSAAQPANPQAPSSVSANQRSGSRAPPPRSESASSMTRMNRLGGAH